MKEKGFKYSKLYLNEYVKKCDKWGKDEIVKRAEILLEKGIEIWWRPDKKTESTDNFEWYDWTDDFDITGMKVREIKLLGTSKEIKYITDATRFIHENLYDLDPTVYHNSRLAWFSKDSDSLRKPYEIGENAYIETNKSGIDQMATIKEIARKMDLNSHDIRIEIGEGEKKQN